MLVLLVPRYFHQSAKFSHIIIKRCETLELPSCTMMIFFKNLVLALAAVNVSAMSIIPTIQTRRGTLSSIAGALAIAPATPVNANGERGPAYIPGVAGGAIYRNLVVDESNFSEGVKSWDPPQPVTKLGKSRILAKELSPLNPALVPFASDNELYYDHFLFGAWTISSTLKRKIYPYGTDYLPSPSLYDGSPRNRAEQPGDSTTYEMHYFSPNADTGFVSNTSKVIADRAFNAISISTGYEQLSQIDEIIWNYKKSPTRMTINFSSLAKDLQPLGQKKSEIYFTSRSSESNVDPVTGSNVFCSSERVRSVVVVPGNVIVSDTETITEFLPVDSSGNHVKAVSRIAVYLTPNPNSREGILWQDVNGKAVGFFDYELDMKRIITNDGSAGVASPDGRNQYVNVETR